MLYPQSSLHFIYLCNLAEHQSIYTVKFITYNFHYIQLQILLLSAWYTLHHCIQQLLHFCDSLVIKTPLKVSLLNQSINKLIPVEFL